MNIKKITDHVSYVGINDRRTWKFENMWPLPFGVSYNSYLVKGNEKVALIDTVEVSSMSVFESQIEFMIEDKKIDYLVVNHMEPDHSGGIPDMLTRYPEMKVIGNRQTIGMLKGYYGIKEEKLIEIKDNEEIDLGDLTLRFILTPLVHWPETMMTLVVEESLIFSGDAFGCFGALNGGVVDDDMDTDPYFPEMYRYYSNIVGKYGKPVQMALKKLNGIDLKYICSTHGPVWHQRLAEVMDIYNRLSLYEGEEGVTIVYGTMYGHTAEIAETIANRLNKRGIKKIKIHNLGKSELSFVISDAFRYKGLIVGGPTYSGKMFPPIEEFMSAMEVREIKNKVVASFGSFTWASAAAKLQNDYFTQMKLQPVASMNMKMAPQGPDYEAAILLADKVADELGY